jgi:hypothetical protein
MTTNTDAPADRAHIFRLREKTAFRIPSRHAMQLLMMTHRLKDTQNKSKAELWMPVFREAVCQACQIALGSFSQQLKK